MKTEKKAKKSKWSKFTCLTHHIRSEVGFQNLRSIAIQNRTFRRNKAMKKIVFGRKDLHRKWRPRKGQKSQNGQNSRVLTHHIRSEVGFQNLKSIVIQNRTFKRNRAMKIIVLGVRIYIGSEDREKGKKVKMLKIHVFIPSYTFWGRILKS